MLKRHLKTRTLIDEMIGWQNQHNRFRIVPGNDQRRQGNRRRSITSKRFQQNGLWAYLQFRQLVLDQKTMVTVGNNHW